MMKLGLYSNKSLEWEIFEVFPDDVSDSLINDYISLLKEMDPDTVAMYQNMDKSPVSILEVGTVK